MKLQKAFKSAMELGHIINDWVYLSNDDLVDNGDGYEFLRMHALTGSIEYSKNGERIDKEITYNDITRNDWYHIINTSLYYSLKPFRAVRIVENDISKAIFEYKNEILKIDSSIVCEIYENDLIFIIAINNDGYEQFKKEINYISFEVHSKFDLEKEIVCMPKKFVSKWDNLLPTKRCFLDIFKDKKEMDRLIGKNPKWGKIINDLNNGKDIV